MTTTTPSGSRTRFPIADAVTSAALALLFLVALVQAMEWSERAGLFPRIVTTLGLALSLGHLVITVIRWLMHRPEPVHQATVLVGDEEEDVDDVEYIFATAGTAAWLRALGWVVAFFVSLYVLGLLITAPLFALVYLRVSARATWLLSVVYAAVTAAALYGVFELALGLQTPPGLFFP